MATAYVALGSNLGDRRATIHAAVDALRRRPDVEMIAVSELLENPAVGGPPGQGPFLNGAARLETTLAPEALLGVLKQTESALGRRPRERWGPREIDLDLILYGDRVVRSDALTLPHPRFRERRFVLAPLAEIAPDAVDPQTGRTIRELLEDLPT